MHSCSFPYQCKSSVLQSTMIRPKAHSASYAVSFRGSFSGGKQLWFDPIHSHSFVDVRIEWSHASKPHSFLFCTEGKHYIYTILGYFTLNFIVRRVRGLYFLMRLRAALLVAFLLVPLLLAVRLCYEPDII